MIRAIIFDMDGVISDTQILYSEVESQVLKRYGVTISPKEITKNYAGVSYSRMLPELFARFAVTANVDVIAQELHDAFDSRSADDEIIPVEGALELIDLLEKQGMILAIASGSRLSFIDHVLTRLGLKDKFRTVTSGYEVVQGKPEPDIFLLAAQRLGVIPEDCVVVEDGVSGMIGAKKAGMKCIGLVKQKDKSLYPADWLVTSLREVTLERIRNL